MKSLFQPAVCSFALFYLVLLDTLTPFWSLHPLVFFYSILSWPGQGVQYFSYFPCNPSPPCLLIPVIDCLQDFRWHQKFQFDLSQDCYQIAKTGTVSCLNVNKWPLQELENYLFLSSSTTKYFAIQIFPIFMFSCSPIFSRPWPLWLLWVPKVNWYSPSSLRTLGLLLPREGRISGSQNSQWNFPLESL